MGRSMGLRSPGGKGHAVVEWGLVSWLTRSEVQDTQGTWGCTEGFHYLQQEKRNLDRSRED
jgi:hypothetical protein